MSLRQYVDTAMYIIEFLVIFSCSSASQCMHVRSKYIERMWDAFANNIECVTCITPALLLRNKVALFCNHRFTSIDEMWLKWNSSASIYVSRFYSRESTNECSLLIRSPALNFREDRMMIHVSFLRMKFIYPQKYITDTRFSPSFFLLV